MVVVFYNPISEEFHNKPHNSCNLDEKIDACVQYVHEFLSIIQTFHGTRKCNLEKCQVGLFVDSLESHSKNLRRSSRFLRKKCTDPGEKYLTGFMDCPSVVENRYFLILRRSNSK